MKLSKDKLIENLQLYLNDLEDYGAEGEFELAESILSPFTTLDETEENLYETIKSTAKTSPEHKQVVTEFLSYLTEFQGKHEIKNINYYQQILDKSNYDQNKRTYLQGVINSIKKQNSLATDNQFNILQRLVKGDFNFGPK
jgi:hypothetical protein